MHFFRILETNNRKYAQEDDLIRFPALVLCRILGGGLAIRNGRDILKLIMYQLT